MLSFLFRLYKYTNTYFNNDLYKLSTCFAIATQSKCSSTLFLPFFAIESLNSLLLISLLIPFAKSLENLSGSIGSKGALFCCSKGINIPVSP